MDKRLEKIMEKVEEKSQDNLNKTAELIYKGASILDEAGGVAGGTLGGVTGLATAAQLSKGLGKYRALATLLGAAGGGVVGTMGGSALGQNLADARRNKEYQELLEAAKVNRDKALIDSVAMRAFNNAGLVTPPRNRTYN